VVVEDPDAQTATISVQLEGFDEDVSIEPAPDGSLRFVLSRHDGERLVLTLAEFARLVHDEQARRPWWGRLLNISSVAGLLWVGLGFLGQALFTGRMLVQWLTSERQRRSVVPVAFWWLSLAGASMLLGYFVWRKDIVGVLGQGTGWAIYVRNLWLLYRPRSAGDESPEGARA
jgi:lipid-A-disaccharide synthase-like uncharacterized protein